MNYGAFEVTSILPTTANNFASILIERELDNSYDSQLNRLASTVDTIISLKFSITTKNKITKDSMINIKIPLTSVTLSSLVPICKNMINDTTITCSYRIEDDQFIIFNLTENCITLDNYYCPKGTQFKIKIINL